MKRIIFILIATFFYSCGIDKHQHIEVVEKNLLLEKDLKVSKDSVLLLKAKIDSLEQQVFILSYPADQRLNNITKLIDENLLDSATIEISNLKRFFPHSKESIKAEEKQETIDKKKLAIKKEEYKEVISLLKRGYSVRNTAKLSNVSVSTVQRVKREFSL